MNIWIHETLSLFISKSNLHLEAPVLQHGTHLWIIPVELGASYVVYLYLLALALLRMALRLVIIGISAWFFLVVSARWDLFLCLSGMVLAKMAIGTSEGAVLPVTSVSSGRVAEGKRRFGGNGGWWWKLLLLLLGLVLASEPIINAAAAPGGWTTLNGFASSVVSSAYREEAIDRFWVAIGAVCVFLSLC